MIEVLKIDLEVRESKIFYAELTVAHVDALIFFSSVAQNYALNHLQK